MNTRAQTWRLKTRTLAFGPLPLLMGIVNVTPDSFSDGGQFLDPGRAADHALRLAAEGADLLDLGGESTRPNATPVSAAEELRRVLPVIERLRGQTTIPLSIDTSKAFVARECVAAGAEIINDVTGLTGDPEMIAVTLSSGAGICAMHMRGTPQTMQDDPTYTDVITEIFTYLKQRRDDLLAAGIAREAICLDPGIGFGKTHSHNLELMANCSRFHELGCPLMVGHSRKGFIGKALQNDLAARGIDSASAEPDRTFGTIGAACALAAQGVQIIRVHDVRAVREALLLFGACGGGEEKV